MFDSVFGRSFNSAKCKTLLRLAISRIKLLRNKRDIQLKQMKRELAQLLQSNQEPSARIRVEHIFREQNIMAAYEVIELFCELIVVRLPIIDSQRLCPIDLREAVASLIFAAPRCSDVPELLQVRNLFSAKYGKEFVIAAAELRPDCGVNRLVIEKLSVRAPPGDVKLKLMKDIAEEQKVDWDPTATESELLKAPEDLLEGPTRFLGASQMSLERPDEDPSMTEPVAQQNQRSDFQDSKETASQSLEAPSDEKQFIPFVLPVVEDQAHLSRKGSMSQSVDSQRKHDTPPELSRGSRSTSLHKHSSFGGDCKEDSVQSVNNREFFFKEVLLAARTAAEAAERAAAAARAAASLASEKFDRDAVESHSDSDDDDDYDDDNAGDRTSQLEGGASEVNHLKSQFVFSNNYSGSERPLFDEPEDVEGSQSSNTFPNRKTIFTEYSDDDPLGAGKSVWPPSAGVGKFDDDGLNSGLSFSKSWNLNKNGTFRSTSIESPGVEPHFDTDQTYVADAEPEDFTSKLAPSRSSHVHPKLPEYDDLSARFAALRSKR